LKKINPNQKQPIFYKKNFEFEEDKFIIFNEKPNFPKLFEFYLNFEKKEENEEFIPLIKEEIKNEKIIKENEIIKNQDIVIESDIMKKENQKTLNFEKLIYWYNILIEPIKDKFDREYKLVFLMDSLLELIPLTILFNSSTEKYFIETNEFLIYNSIKIFQYHINKKKIIFPFKLFIGGYPTNIENPIKEDIQKKEIEMLKIILKIFKLIILLEMK